MIVAFSTSSPWTSVALLTAEGKVLATEKSLAPMRASEACLSLLEALSVDLTMVSMFVSDLGPGSFTGVRVGVTIAKTLAFARSVKVAGLASFDLIAPDQTVAIPSKKGEYFVRTPGQVPVRMVERPSGNLVGFGPWFEGVETFPDASAFGPTVGRLIAMEPEALIPLYLMEPSITQPKKPFATGDPVA